MPKVKIPLVGTFGGFTVSVPKIPQIPLLAKGGIVTAPTLAMIGEAGKEAVIPLSKLNSMIGNNNSSNIIQVILDGKVIAEHVDNRLGRKMNALRGGAF